MGNSYNSNRSGIKQCVTRKNSDLIHSSRVRLRKLLLIRTREK